MQSVKFNKILLPSFMKCRTLFNTSNLFRSSQSNDIVDPPDEIIYNISKPERVNETFEKQKARLIYQSRKRAMLENDLVLSTFASKYLDKMTPQQINEYDRLINTPSNDWDIYYWVTETKPTPPEFNTDVMTMLKLHCKNANREMRIRQPDLKICN